MHASAEVPPCPAAAAKELAEATEAASTAGLKWRWHGLAAAARRLTAVLLVHPFTGHRGDAWDDATFEGLELPRGRSPDEVPERAAGFVDAGMSV